MDAIQIGSIVVATIAAVASWASQKAASRAATRNTDSTLEAKRLEQAYERARKFDIETIEQQDKKLQAQAKEIEELRSDQEVREAQILALRIRVTHLELELGIQPPKGEPT